MSIYPRAIPAKSLLNMHPVAIGGHGSTIDLTYFDGLAAQNSQRDIQGTGVVPADITISEVDTYDFGTIPTGGALIHLFTLNNIGGYTASLINELTLAAPFNFTGGSFPGAGGSCTANLTATTSCTIEVAFSPTAIGPQNGTITIEYFDGAVTQNKARLIQGTAVTPANLVISDAPLYDFGSPVLGSSVDKTFTIDNLGGFTASSIVGGGILTPYNYKDGIFPGTGGTCAPTLAPSTNCTIVVTYSPVAVGTDNDTVEIDYFDGVNTQTADRDVTGTGVTPAFITVAESPLLRLWNRSHQWCQYPYVHLGKYRGSSCNFGGRSGHWRPL